MVIDKEQYLTNMAQAVAKEAKKNLDAIPKKGKREAVLMDYNFVLAVYMIPGIVHFPGESGKKLSEKLLAAWKETFPSTNVQASDFETINAGFKENTVISPLPYVKLLKAG